MVKYGEKKNMAPMNMDNSMRVAILATLASSWEPNWEPKAISATFTTNLNKKTGNSSQIQQKK